MRKWNLNNKPVVNTIKHLYFGMKIFTSKSKTLLFVVLFSLLTFECSVRNKTIPAKKQRFGFESEKIPFVLKNNRIVAKVILNDTIKSNLFYDNNIGSDIFKFSLSSSFVRKHFVNNSFLSNVVTINYLPESGFSVSNKYSNDSLKLSTLNKTIAGYNIYNKQSLIANDFYDGIINFTDSLFTGDKIQEINFDEQYIRFLTGKEFEQIDLSEFLKFNFIIKNNNIIIKINLSLTDCKEKEYVLNGLYIWDLGNPTSIILNPNINTNKILFKNLENNCMSRKTNYYYLKGKTRVLSFYQINKFSLFNEDYINKGLSILPSPFNSDVLSNVNGILPVNLIKTHNYYIDMANRIIYAKRRKNIENLSYSKITSYWKLHLVSSRYVVVLVKKDSPVDKAGIQCGDTIFKINDQLPTNFDKYMLENLNFIGDSITILFGRKKLINKTIIYNAN